MLEMMKTSSRKYGLASYPHPPWAPTHLQQTPAALDHIVSAGPSNPILPCLVWGGNGGLWVGCKWSLAVLWGRVFWNVSNARPQVVGPTGKPSTQISLPRKY